MKKRLVFLASLMFLTSALYADNTQNFNEYGILTPNVNKLETREEFESPAEPTIFIVSRDRNDYILEYDISKKNLSLIH